MCGIVGELDDPTTYAGALQHMDVVIHLASEININGSIDDPLGSIERNLHLMSGLLETLRKGDERPLVVFTSTDRVYGQTRKSLVNESERAIPIEPYTASKMMCETLLQTYGRLYDIPYIILRLDSIYGEGQSRSMFISDVIHKMIAEDTVKVGNIALRKNFVYAGDVARAILLAVEAKASARNTEYNIGGPSIDFGKIIQKLQRLIGGRLGKKIQVVPNLEAQRPSSIEVRPFRLSTAKARRDLGWQPEVSIDEGLKRTFEDIYSHYE